MRQASIFEVGDNPAKVARFYGTNKPRHLRALDALLSGAKVSREDMDRITGASNSPHVISELRKLGLPDRVCLGCVRRAKEDRDGKTVRPGYFYLTAEGRRRVQLWLSEQCKTLAEMLAEAAEG